VPAACARAMDSSGSHLSVGAGGGGGGRRPRVAALGAASFGERRRRVRGGWRPWPRLDSRRAHPTAERATAR